MNNLTQLNEEQFAAATTIAKRVLVLAGPGSGKTKTLIERLLWLSANTDVQHSEIIVITYTNAAADELQARFKKAHGGECRLGWIGTLHSFMLKLLREHGYLVGLPKTLTVADDDQRESLLEAVMADMGSKVSMKRALASLDAKKFCDSMARVTRSKDELVAIEYFRRLRREGVLDFDSLLYYGWRLIQKLGAGVGGRAWPYQALLVDEFQDSADMDIAIYDAMLCEWKFFVGDPDQAIYSFRGGNVRNIVALADRCATPKSPALVHWELHTLETNYRCRSKIAEAAQRLVERNPGRVAKRTLAAKEGGSVKIYQCESPAAEMCLVLEKIQDAVAQLCTYKFDKRPSEHFNGIAVLARTNKQCEQIAEFLAARGVPVARRERDELPADWAQAKALLAALANPGSDLAVYGHLVHVVGKSAADSKRREAVKRMVSLNAECINRYSDTSLGAVGHLRQDGASNESIARVMEGYEVLNDERAQISDVLLILSSGERAREEGDGVVVTTLHGAKGREWRTVFVVGCEEKLLPSAKSIKLDDSETAAAGLQTIRCERGLSEERRLMFVGMTRAEDRLVLTWCASRPTSRGPNLPPGPAEPREASRFLKEAGL